MYRVAAQLLSRNGSAYFPYLLASLCAQTYKDWQLFVADNGSTPEESLAMQKAIQESGIANVHFERFHPNCGFAGGHNRLFAHHSAEFALLLNDDAILEPTYIENLVAYMDAHPKVASVEGRVYRWDFDQKDTDGEGKTQIIDTFGLECARGGRVRDILAGQVDTAANLDHIDKEVFGVSGCLPLYRQAAVLASSPEGTLFDPYFGSYKEDVELAFRLRDAGYTSVTVGKATAHHRRSFHVQNRQVQPFETLFLSYRNHVFVLIMHMFGSSVGMSWWRVWGAEGLKLAYWLVKRPKVAICAWWHILRAFPRLLRKRAFFAKLRADSHV